MKRLSILNTTRYKRRKNEKLQAGLSYTPAQMWQMTKEGVPVSTDNSNQFFYEGSVDLEWEPTAERLRGIDPATLWNMQQDAKKKARHAYKSARTAFDSINSNNNDVQ